MGQRQFAIGLLVLAGILYLSSMAFSATGDSGYEAYIVLPNQTITMIAVERQVSPEILAQYTGYDANYSSPYQWLLKIPLDMPSTLPSYNLPEQDSGDEGSFESGFAITVPAAETQLQPNQAYCEIAVVTAKRAEIRTEPDGGNVIWGKLAAGTEIFVIRKTETHYAVPMADGSTGWIPRLAVSLTGVRQVVTLPAPPEEIVAEKAQASEGRPAIIDTAMEYLGIRYKLGGRLPNSVDCSLLVQTVFKRHGISLPRTAAEQFRVGTRVDDSHELLPGDRLYFYDPRFTKIGHTGIYIGEGRFIHASSNCGEVAISSLSESTYARKYAGARR